MEGQITIGLPYKASCTLSDSMVRQEAGLSTAGAESQAIPLTALKMTIFKDTCFENEGAPFLAFFARSGRQTDWSIRNMKDPKQCFSS